MAGGFSARSWRSTTLDKPLDSTRQHSHQAAFGLGTPTEVGCGPEGQVANDHTVGLATVFVHQDHLSASATVPYWSPTVGPTSVISCDRASCIRSSGKTPPSTGNDDGEDPRPSRHSCRDSFAGLQGTSACALHHLSSHCVV